MKKQIFYVKHESWDHVFTTVKKAYDTVKKEFGGEGLKSYSTVLKQLNESPFAMPSMYKDEYQNHFIKRIDFN